MIKIVVVLLMLLLVSCSGTNDRIMLEENLKCERAQNNTLTLNRCEINIGNIHTNENGSIGLHTETSELYRLLRNNNCDMIEITYTWLTPTKAYTIMPFKLVYNRRTEVLYNIFLDNGNCEVFTNIDEKGLIKFLKKGNKSFYDLGKYCKNMAYRLDVK